MSLMEPNAKISYFGVGRRLMQIILNVSKLGIKCQSNNPKSTGKMIGPHKITQWETMFRQDISLINIEKQCLSERAHFLADL